MEICLAFSPGGHFTEMQRIIHAFKGHDIFFVTIKVNSTRNLTNVYYLKDTAGPTKIHMMINMLIVLIQTIGIIIKKRPRLIISTGADVTIPLCYLGKFFGAKVIFIESICRINDLSVTGKLVYLISDLFLVQWENLTKKYRRAKYFGSVL